MFNFLFGNPKNKTVWYYVKIFFFMLIPFFGFFSTLYLAFIEDRDKDIRNFGRAALIIRILLDILLLVVLALVVIEILPKFASWTNGFAAMLRMIR